MTTTSTTVIVGTSPDLITFTGSTIKSCDITEQIDPISLTVPFDTVDIHLFSDTDAFNILDPTGFYANLVENEIIDAYETVDGNQIYKGRFYLKDWDSVSPQEMVLSGIDGIGLMNDIPYHGGLWVPSVTSITDVILVEDLLDEIIVDAAGLTYVADGALAIISTELTGWFPKVSCREALQQVLVRIGAYATCANSSDVLIKQTVLAADGNIDLVLSKTLKAQNSPIALRPIVTGVEVHYHDYTKVIAYDSDGDGSYETNSKVLFDGSIVEGDYTIYLDPDIAYDYGHIYGQAMTATTTAENATPTYYSFTCTGAGTWNLVMLGFYKHSHWPVSVIASSYKKENKVIIEDATLIDVDSADTIANLIYDYYQQRYVVKTKLFGHPTISVGKLVLVETLTPATYILGTVEKANIDLAHGYVSEVEIVGEINTPENVLYPAKYNDDFVGISYIGTWNTAAAGSAYEGDLHYVPTNENGEARFVFFGNYLTMVYSQLTDRGSVEIYIDDVLVDTVSENGAEAYQTEWTSDELTNNFHTAKLVHVDGAVTDLDAVEIGGYFVAGKYDDIAFMNMWDLGADAETYSVGYLNTQSGTVGGGDQFEITFYGKFIHVGFISFNTGGSLFVQIDSDSEVEIDTSADAGAGMVSNRWKSDELTLGTHTLIVHDDVASSILFDYIEIFNTYTATAALEFYDGTIWEDYDENDLEEW
jgi:hypothetical protein